VKHRHLEPRQDVPVEELPSAALVDLFERGDLSDWQPILAAIRARPGGALAERVMVLVDRFPMYGTSPVLRAWIDRMRAAARWAIRPGPVGNLKTLRKRRGLTQTRLAQRMGMSQSDLSKLEHRADVRLSTLRSFVEALDGHLTLIAALPDASLRISIAKDAMNLFQDLPDEAKERARRKAEAIGTAPGDSTAKKKRD